MDLGDLFVWEEEIHCVAAESNYKKRVHFFYLFDEIGLAASFNFFWEWVAVVWWAAFYDVCDEDFCAV